MWDMEPSALTFQGVTEEKGYSQSRQSFYLQRLLFTIILAHFRYFCVRSQSCQLEPRLHLPEEALPEVSRGRPGPSCPH